MRQDSPEISREISPGGRPGEIRGAASVVLLVALGVVLVGVSALCFGVYRLARQEALESEAIVACTRAGGVHVSGRGSAPSLCLNPNAIVRTK